MHIKAPALFAYHDRHAADFEAFAVELSRLEGGSRAFLCASWPAALALAALGTVGPGGHLLYHHDVAADSLHWFQRAAATLGIHAEPVAADEPAKVADGLARGARAVFAQQLPEDVVRELDTKALAWHCRAFGAHLFVDNTELTPVLAKPLALGADVVLHRHGAALCGTYEPSFAALIVADELLAERLSATAEALGVQSLLPVHPAPLLDGLGSLRVRVEAARTTTRALAERLRALSGAERLSHQHIGQYLRLSFSSVARAEAVLHALPVHFLSAGRTPTMTLVSPSQGTSGVGHGSSIRMRTGLEPAAALWPPLAAALAIGGDSLVAAAPSEP